MMIDHNQINIIRSEIDNIKEYMDTEICRKCNDMKSKLDDLYQNLNSYLTKDYSE